MSGFNVDPWLAVPLMLGAMMSLLAGLRIWQVLASPHPELVRKIFHLGGGVLALPLPWLFSSPSPVLVLGAANFVLFALLRVVPALRNGPGQVLAAVERHTVGEFCFVLSLLLLFAVAHRTPLLYGVPLLVLGVADAFAALVGREYGKRLYSVIGGSKSLEGSLAFFFAAFLCVHVPVLLFTDTPRLECLLIGVNIGIMVMMAEAAAWWGLDNLIIPAFSYVLLRSFLGLDASALTEHLGFLAGLSLFIHFWRKRTTLADDGLFGVSLWGYVAWAIGGWEWVVPSLILITVYTSVTMQTPDSHVRRFNFPVALANLFGGIVWLLLYWQTADPRLFSPFAAVFGTDLAIIALVRQRHAAPESRPWRSVAVSCVKGVMLLIPSILLFRGANIEAAMDIAAAALAVLTSTLWFARTQPALEQFPVGNDRWLRQALIAGLGSLLALIPAMLLTVGGTP